MKIHAIQTGSVSIKSKQRIGQGRGLMRQLNLLFDREWTEFLPIYAWAIEHPTGVIVVDTGETAKTAQSGYFPKWHPYYRLAVRLKVLPEQEIGPQLRSIGIRPEDVRQVIMTHLHTDHAGGLSHFPSSEILVSGKDYKIAKTLAGKVSGYLPQHWPSWFKPISLNFEQTPCGPFKSSYRATKQGDILVVPTPGHTAAHVSVIVRNSECDVFLAGDTTYTEQALINRQVDGVSSNARVTLQTIDNILELAKDRRLVYLPAHDPQSVRRLQTRQILGAA